MCSEELDDIEALGLFMFLIVLTAFSILLAKRLRRLVMGVLEYTALLALLDADTLSEAAFELK